MQARRLGSVLLENYVVRYRKERIPVSHRNGLKYGLTECHLNCRLKGEGIKKADQRKSCGNKGTWASTSGCMEK
jgi:hypothetical protein